MRNSELYKILVVDDEILVRQGIKHILNWEQDGFQIVGEASNGKEALELIKKLRPHIVLTDIVMPVMDGEELTRLIKLNWPEIEVIVLSSFSEFDYVRSTFQSGVSDYILKPHLETGMLLEVLRKTTAKLPMLNPGRTREDYTVSMHQALDKLLARYELQLDRATVAEWFPHPHFYVLGSSSGKLVLDELKALFPKMVEAELPNAPIAGYPELAVYVVNVDDEGRELLPLKLKMLHPSSVTEQGEIMWVLSESFHPLDQLGDIYHDSWLKLLQYRFFLPQKALLMPSELPPVEEARDFPLQSFMEQIRRLQLKEAFRELGQFVQQHTSAYKAEVFEFKSLIGNILFNAIHMLGSLNLNVTELDEAKYAYFKAIDEARHVSDIEALLEEFRRQAEECVQAVQQSQQGGNPSMKLLLDYIDEHYAEPISLTEMARHFHFNPSYLSSFFATHHHESFKEHLNRVRIDKAADLLRNGDIPISEISSRVGYGDHSYFCKVFKKSTGLSPTQYRRQYFKRVEKEQR
ncbi:response regulator transcription factor [Paenibacillus lentus]|uniref:DNA-binding response regulator n=1 Tax=Paenibacillus lentus TaxID=1338368 RepID=A0A3S8S006_9BACL|nr:response regulator transcription factor [Paenibacillus lentus]AZK48439.1 DNA-binding response regulator [Paenibacillus lentus]